MSSQAAAAAPARADEWHVISCEYPPQLGGVSGYVASLCAGLAAEGRQVHVWCPGTAGAAPPQPAGVTVQGELGRFAPEDLRRVGDLLDAFRAPRRLLVQWVPQGYGYRSVNLPFCLWIRQRVRRGDIADIMVHEPFLAFEGSWKQRLAALGHRVMTVALLSAARRVWVSTPAWRRSLQPYAFGRDLGYRWLPIPSPVSPVEDPDGVSRLRANYAPPFTRIVGHFGTYSRLTAGPVHDVMTTLLATLDAVVVLLMGQGSERLRDEIVNGRPEMAGRVHATGVLALQDLSRHLQVCDVFAQPYPEGITGRRTSAMSALAHGKPVVTTEGRLSEPIWREREAVRLVRAGDPAGFAAELQQLLADPSMRAQLGARGRELYDDMFDIRHTVRALIEG